MSALDFTKLLQAERKKAANAKHASTTIQQDANVAALASTISTPPTPTLSLTLPPITCNLAKLRVDGISSERFVLEDYRVESCSLPSLYCINEVLSEETEKEMIRCRNGLHLNPEGK